MAKHANADATPEKRLFVSLLTRDISLIDAVIDLADNAVNAAMKSLKGKFSSTKDFMDYFAKEKPRPTVTINIKIARDRIEVIDNASGINFDSAKNDVFRFGHSEGVLHSRDRLSVYGIGMKRALFKIGNKVSIVSDHKSGGFSLDVDVADWTGDSTLPWAFPIASRAPKGDATGTKIAIWDLHDDIERRVSEPRFVQDLIDKLSRIYSYFLDKVVVLSVNGKSVSGTEFEFGSNYSHDRFKSDGVDCTISAGIATPTGNRFLSGASGWFVFCNFRTVIYGDKSTLTGWGSTLPLYMPKHRPFLGLVTFTSPDPEDLPWTTTKGSINEDNLIWQEARARMVGVAKPVLKVLDARYSDDGTDIEASRVAEMAGTKVNIFEATVSKSRTFRATERRTPKEVRVQYNAKMSDIEKIRKYFSQAKMSASEVGRKTFEFFLRNEIGS